MLLLHEKALHYLAELRHVLDVDWLATMGRDEVDTAAVRNDAQQLGQR